MLPKDEVRREVVTICRGGGRSRLQEPRGTCPRLPGPLFFEDRHNPFWHDPIMTTRKLIEQPRVWSTSKIIASLNSLSLGNTEVIGAKLAEARQACLELDENELADRLEEAHGALLRGDVETYRKRVKSVVSRLGHRR